jgi:hypothetical protein
MGIDIRLPNITATDTEGKMSQMQSYMHQLVEQLNWALATVDNAIQGNTANVSVTSQNGSNSEKEAIDTFNSIKALIIKSADIVTAYEETMREDFNGEYVAVSDFGTYTQKTDLAIETNSKGVTELYTNVQSIDKDVKETNAYIKRGELEDGIYGIEVGQTDANNVFSHYARFTAKRLSFYDEYGNEVAYIGSTEKSGSKLYINTAHFLGSVQFGDYKADTSDGLAFLWIGG